MSNDKDTNANHADWTTSIDDDGNVFLSGGILESASDVILKAKELNPGLETSVGGTAVMCIHHPQRSYYMICNDPEKDEANSRKLRFWSEHNSIPEFYDSSYAPVMIQKVRNDIRKKLNKQFLGYTVGYPASLLIPVGLSMSYILFGITVATPVVYTVLAMMIAIISLISCMGGFQTGSDQIKTRCELIDSTTIKIVNVQPPIGIFKKLFKKRLEKLVTKYAKVVSIEASPGCSYIIKTKSLNMMDKNITYDYVHHLSYFSELTRKTDQLNDNNLSNHDYISRIREKITSITELEAIVFNDKKISESITEKMRILDNESVLYDAEYYRKFLHQLTDIENSLKTLSNKDAGIEEDMMDLKDLIKLKAEAKTKRKS